MDFRIFDLKNVWHIPWNQYTVYSDSKIYDTYFLSKQIFSKKIKYVTYPPSNNQIIHKLNFSKRKVKEEKMITKRQ